MGVGRLQFIVTEGLALSVMSDVGRSFKFLAVYKTFSEYLKFQKASDLSCQKCETPATSAHESASSNNGDEERKNSKSNPVLSDLARRRFASLVKIKFWKSCSGLERYFKRRGAVTKFLKLNMKYAFSPSMWKKRTRVCVLTYRSCEKRR